MDNNPQPPRQIDEKDIEIAELRGRVKALESVAKQTPAQHPVKVIVEDNYWSRWGFGLSLLGPLFIFGFPLAIIGLYLAPKRGNKGLGLSIAAILISIIWFMILSAASQNQ